MSTLFLVDGSVELFRCFHGAPRAQDEQGREVGLLRALTWTLVKLLKREELTHVAFAVDVMARPARNDGSADSLLRAQAPRAMELVRALGITVWPMVRYQADDGLATGAARFGDQVDQVVICTSDKDLLQCIRGERIVLLNRSTKKITDEAALRERFGIGPEQIPDLFGLMGDPSDGLTGLPGWGAKSASTVLARYGRIDDIPEAPWDVKVRGAARLSATLEERRLEAVLQRDLSRLRDDLPLPHTLDDLVWRGPRDDLRQLAAELGAEGAVDWLEGLES